MVKTRYKPTEELRIFRLIWLLSDKKSFISGESLSAFEGSDRFLNCFAHVLSKAKNKYPHFRLYLGGIKIITPEEHFIIDQGTLEDRTAYCQRVKSANFDKWDTLEEELRELYCNVFPERDGIMIMKYSEEEVREKIASLNSQCLYTLERNGEISRSKLLSGQAFLKTLQQ